MRWSFCSFVVALAAIPVPRAAACGGFFCSTAPIVQSRESVVYSYDDDGTLTMAVQVTYEGRDEDFAWILPVPVPPDEITVGTDALFSALQTATEPQFNLSASQSGRCAAASCSYPSGAGGCNLALGDAAPRSSSGWSDAGARLDAGSTVQVFSERSVGPYDTVVLSATTAAEVIEWLDAEGYDIPATSEPLLEPYARQGFAFVALRLNANRDSSVIRPIVMRMATDEACLPIRLTAIASTPGLPINLYFLADGQARSSNYSYVDPTTDPGFWRAGVSSIGATWGSRRPVRPPPDWDDAVARASAEVGGRAFATDYADTTPTVAIAMPEIDDLIDAPSAGQLIEGLFGRGYGGTRGPTRWRRGERGDILRELLERYMEAPSTDDPTDYFDCVAAAGSVRGCGGEPMSFDAAGLIGAIEAEITIPARLAQETVDRHPFTTRLSTTMRVGDMTVDPVFVLDPELPDVPRVRNATIWTRCSSEYFPDNAPRELELDGRMYPFSSGRIVSEEAYCRSRGGTVDRGGCSAAANNQASTFVLVTLAGLALMAVYRRRRR